MSDVLASTRTAAVTGHSRRLSVPVALAWQDAPRLTRHPILLIAFAYLGLFLLLEGDTGPRAAFTLLTDVPTMLYGGFVVFAANLLASRERRSGNEEWLDSMPASPAARTTAAQLAVLGPLVLVSALVAVGFVVSVATDQFITPPTLLEVLSGLLPVLGGGLLGVMVARWLPWPGMAALVMVGLIALHVWLNDGSRKLLGAYVEWAAWSAGGNSGAWAGLIPGSRGWHVTYLLALCAMAATGAHLIHARRKLPVLAVGGVFTALAVLAGWAQLA